jgi:hypothetical protein
MSSNQSDVIILSVPQMKGNSQAKRSEEIANESKQSVVELTQDELEIIKQSAFQAGVDSGIEKGKQMNTEKIREKILKELSASREENIKKEAKIAEQVAAIESKEKAVSALYDELKDKVLSVKKQCEVELREIVAEIFKVMLIDVLSCSNSIKETVDRIIDDYYGSANIEIRAGKIAYQYLSQHDMNVLIESNLEDLQVEVLSERKNLLVDYNKYIQEVFDALRG